MGNETLNQPTGSTYGPPPSFPPAGPGFPPVGPPQQADSRNAGKGLAITALCLAIVSLVLCWVPIVNNLVFFLGLLALAFAVPALVISLRKRSSARGMSIAATVIAVVSLVGVLASQAMYSSMIDSVGKSIEDASDGVVEAAPQEQEKADAGALALGVPAAVGSEYQVTVKSVNLNAGEVLAAVNEFNAPATQQYILVDVAVTYTGAEEGDPWIDLDVRMIGSDARQYSSTTCTATVERSGFDVPTLENGGSGEFQVCMDVPAAALESAKIFVEPTFTLQDGQRVYWNAK